MNPRRRFAAVRSLSIEKLERRSMLAADAGECLIDSESLGFVGEESQDIPTSNCWLQPDVWVCALPAFEFIPTDDSVTDEPATDEEASSVTDPDSVEPVTDPAAGEGLAEGFSLTVEPLPCEFERTGIIAVDPTVIVDPVLEVGVGQLIDNSGIDEGWILVETGWGDTGWAVDPSTDAVPSDEQAVEGDDTATVDKVFIEPWFRRLGDGDDPVVCVYGGPIFWCGFSLPFVAEQVDDTEVSAESVDTLSPSDNQLPAVVLSSGAAAPPRANSAATAQAFASFAVSLGQASGQASVQGGSDVQAGLPFVGSRRTNRR